MLVTDTSWAECHPVRRALAMPYQAWRCVGWTNETPNFLIIAARALRDADQLPDGWLVGGAEALLEAASQLQPGGLSVYVLNRTTDDGQANFSQVTGLWRERELMGGVPWFWYSTSHGEFVPCSRAQLLAEPQPELVRELIFASGPVPTRTKP